MWKILCKRCEDYSLRECGGVRRERIAVKVRLINHLKKLNTRNYHSWEEHRRRLRVTSKLIKEKSRKAFEYNMCKAKRKKSPYQYLLFVF